MFIYKITNKINNKLYIGQTIGTIERRFKEHCFPSSFKKNTAISAAINKYGEENFSVEMLEQCNNIDELNTREIYWISKLNSLAPCGYNLNSGGDSAIPSDDARKRMSEARKGMASNFKNPIERALKISKNRRGIKMTNEQREFIKSANHKKPSNKRSSSQFKGVSKKKYGFEANIFTNNKPTYIGKFVNELNAAFAYNYYAVKFFGNDCYLNMISDN